MLSRLTSVFAESTAKIGADPVRGSRLRSLVGERSSARHAETLGGRRNFRSLLYETLAEAVPEADTRDWRIRFSPAGQVELSHPSLDGDTVAFAEDLVNEVLTGPNTYGADGRAAAERISAAVPQLVSRLEEEFELDNLQFTYDPDGRPALFHDELDTRTLAALEGQLQEWLGMLGLHIA